MRREADTLEAVHEEVRVRFREAQEAKEFEEERSRRKKN